MKIFILLFLGFEWFLSSGQSRTEEVAELLLLEFFPLKF